MSSPSFLGRCRAHFEQFPASQPSSERSSLQGPGEGKRAADLIQETLSRTNQTLAWLQVRCKARTLSTGTSISSSSQALSPKGEKVGTLSSFLLQQSLDHQISRRLSHDGTYRLDPQRPGDHETSAHNVATAISAQGPAAVNIDHSVRQTVVQLKIPPESSNNSDLSTTNSNSSNSNSSVQSLSSDSLLQPSSQKVQQNAHSHIHQHKPLLKREPQEALTNKIQQEQQKHTSQHHDQSELNHLHDHPTLIDHQPRADCCALDVTFGANAALPYESRSPKETLLRSEDPDRPGRYVIVHDQTFVSKTVVVPAEEEIIDVLVEGSEVLILEVVRRDEDKRVRGRIEAPSGWISLLDTETGYRWAESMEALERVSPLPCLYENEVSNWFYAHSSNGDLELVKQDNVRTPRSSVVVKPASMDSVGTVCRKPRAKSAAKQL